MIGAAVDGLAARNGLEADSLRTGFLLLTNMLLVPGFRALATARDRHLFSVLAASLSYCLMFSVLGFVQLLALALASYVLVRKARSAFWLPVLVFGLNMTVMSLNHLYRQWILGAEARMDHTVPMMVMVMKLTSFAWSAHDGTLPDERQRAIRRLPSTLEFLGFVFFFPSFLIGPTFAYVDYDHFIRREADFAEVPASFIPAMECFAASFIPMFLLIKVVPHYTPTKLLDPDFVAGKTFWQQLMYLHISTALAKCVFYVGWKTAEASCVLAGFGYNGRGIDGHPRWDRLENCDILRIEMAENPRELLAAWNKNTANWLREDVYLRLEQAGVSNSMATTITAFVSAFWHGVQFGYYFGFLFLSVVTILARHVRRHVRPLFVDPASKLRIFKPLYDAAGVVVTQAAIMHVMSPFLLCSFWACMTVFSRIYFAGHIVLLALLAGFETGALVHVSKAVGRAVGVSPPGTRRTGAGGSPQGDVSFVRYASGRSASVPVVRLKGGE
nr:lysophospholipid acyltransferase [Polyrhizophydium stewartii]